MSGTSLFILKHDVLSIVMAPESDAFFIKDSDIAEPADDKTMSEFLKLKVSRL